MRLNTPASSRGRVRRASTAHQVPSQIGSLVACEGAEGRLERRGIDGVVQFYDSGLIALHPLPDLLVYFFPKFIDFLIFSDILSLDV